MNDRRETRSIKGGRTVDVGRLQSDVEWAIGKGLGARDLIPMLERLCRHAVRGSSPACFARTELAELLLPKEPWRAAVLLREVLEHEETDRAYALLGLALSLLGHYESARSAYVGALRLAPACMPYAHNLGHLLDVGLGRPRDGLRWLEVAYRDRPYDAELAASYAHALVGLGRVDEAREALVGAMAEVPGAAEELLERWLSTAKTP